MLDKVFLLYFALGSAYVCDVLGWFGFEFFLEGFLVFLGLFGVFCLSFVCLVFLEWLLLLGFFVWVFWGGVCLGFFVVFGGVCLFFLLGFFGFVGVFLCMFVLFGLVFLI